LGYVELGFKNQVQHDLRNWRFLRPWLLRRSPIQHFSRAAVQKPGDVVERGLADLGEVGTLGQEVAQVDLQPLGQLGVAGRLAAAIVGQALAQKRGQLLHLPREASHAREHDEPGLALDQRADR
jgi:hypothetical protein